MRSARNRDIVIFSVAAVDLFASGMGAFLIIAVILFPFFDKVRALNRDAEDLQAEIEEASQMAEEAKARTDEAEEETRELLAKATPLMQIQNVDPTNPMAFARGCWRTDRWDAGTSEGVSRICLDTQDPSALLGGGSDRGVITGTHVYVSESRWGTGMCATGVSLAHAGETLELRFSEGWCTTAGEVHGWWNDVGGIPCSAGRDGAVACELGAKGVRFHRE